MFAFGDGAPRPLPRGAEPDDIAADFTAWELTDVKELPLGDGSTPSGNARCRVVGFACTAVDRGPLTIRSNWSARRAAT